MKSIAMLMPYFGKWPEWISLYFESVRHNPTIDWHFFTDCERPDCAPDNVFFHKMALEDYAKIISDKLGISYTSMDPYKICDIRPAFGYIHEEIIREYDCYGWGDIDLVYGDIRKIYTDEILSSTCVSADEWGLSGHLMIFRNEEKVRNSYRRLISWRKIMSDPEHHGIDDNVFTKVFKRYKSLPSCVRYILTQLDPIKKEAWFKELYTTILRDRNWHDGEWEHPEVWFWKDGRVTNDRDGDREFLCFHFLNWKSNRYLDPRRGEEAAWSGLGKLNHVPYGKECEGFKMDRLGFHPFTG